MNKLNTKFVKVNIDTAIYFNISNLVSGFLRNSLIPIYYKHHLANSMLKTNIETYTYEKLLGN